MDFPALRVKLIRMNRVDSLIFFGNAIICQALAAGTFAASPPDPDCRNPVPAPAIHRLTEESPPGEKLNPLAGTGIVPGPGTVKTVLPLTAPPGESPWVAVLRIAVDEGVPPVNATVIAPVKAPVTASLTPGAPAKKHAHRNRLKGASGAAKVDVFRWTGCRYERIRTVEAGEDSEGAEHVDLADIPVAANWVWVNQHSCGAHPPCSDDITGYGPNDEVSSLSLNDSWDLQDLDGDGVMEIVEGGADGMECHICRPMLTWESFLRWNPARHEFEGVDFTEVIETKIPRVRELNARAGAAKKNGSLCEAGRLIEKAGILEPKNPALQWNLRVIKSELTQGVDDELLRDLQNRCYTEAADLLAVHPVKELFSADLNPYALLDDADAEEPVQPGMLAARRNEFAVHVLGVVNDEPDGNMSRVPEGPEKAPALFFRAWGKFLSNPDDPEILPVLEQSVKLEPRDQFFRSCLAYLKPRRPPANAGKK